MRENYKLAPVKFYDKVNLLMERIYSLVSWPVLVIRGSRGGLEPSAIAPRRPRRIFRKTLNNNDLNQVVASSGFSENKGLGGWDAQSRGLIKPGLGYSYYRIFPPSLTGDVTSEIAEEDWGRGWRIYIRVKEYDLTEF